ncbi:HK97 family phage major capsid protein/HK97 family phage prohead protease [Rhizobium sp. BK226]|uniref:phage major capsid protein n=1 Tax=Rhizobium sp. BK226 TaxID=2587075 RepID=UPI001611A154|nr:phage major capsid protein [Rhizobium sp. BK226]MBB4113465.1 HK97 family phage major capsid protein/HK97 family phage prohead protease [Rhizobium sp. BK226]
MQLDRMEVKASFTADESGAIEGVAWDFSSPDRVGDVIEPAAFASAVGKSIPALFAHDQSQVVGVFDSISVDADGLKVKGKLLVDTVERAREVRSMIQIKAVQGLSIGFMTRKAAPRKGGGRTIQELELLETSIVAIPAHPGARITSQKELPMPANAETKTVEELAVELKAANDNIALVTKRLETAETALARPAIIGNAANDNNEPTTEQKAFGAYIRSTPHAPVSAEELKTLTVSSDPAGGYLAPAEFSTEFVRDLVQFSPIRAIASVRTTGSPSVIYPARTGITNAKWKGETQAQEGSEPAFGQAEIPVNEINTYVDISNQLLADSAGVAESEVRLALAEDFGQKEATAFLTGTGSNMPKGLFVDTAIASKAASAAAAINFDDFIGVFYDLPAVYRNAGTWGMNSKTLAAARKLKDNQGQYLWTPSPALGQPESILGRPVVELLEADDIGANKSPVIFGDFSGYRIVDRLALSILVNPYIRATDGITRIHATRRVGGSVLQPAKFRKLKNPAS